MMNRTISALLLAGTLGTLTSPVIAQECKLRVTTWVFSLLVDVNVYIEPIRRGCSVF